MNEFLFYGGLAAAGLAVIGFLIHAIVSRKNLALLNKILDSEYGED